MYIPKKGLTIIINRKNHHAASNRKVFRAASNRIIFFISDFHFPFVNIFRFFSATGLAIIRFLSEINPLRSDLGLFTYDFKRFLFYKKRLKTERLFSFFTV